MPEKSYDPYQVRDVSNAPPLKAKDFDSISIGDELVPKRYGATRGDLVNYSGVSGDANPIHFSDIMARRLGLEQVCAHGMFTMGIGTAYIVQWLGDPRAIKDYLVRFTSPWYIDPDAPGYLEFTGKVKSLDPVTRTGVLALNARQDDRRIFGRATAKVQFS